jgi:hypothetical protein
MHDAIHDDGQNKKDAVHSHDDASLTIDAQIEEHAAQEKHRAAERDYWTDERSHNKWVTSFSAVAASAAILAAIIAGGAYFETRRQAEAAVQQLAIQASDQRPWLHLEDVKTEQMNYNVNGLMFTTRFSVKNYGRSPAVHTAVQAVLIPRKDDALAEERTLCETSWNKSGPLVFMGTPQEFPITLTFSKDDLALERKYFEAQGSKIFSVWMTVLVCVQYDSLYDTHPHHEGHAYNLNAPSGHPSFLTPSIID